MSNDDYDDTNVWGDIVLPKVLAALGIEGAAKAVRLHFEYGQFATATISRDGLEDDMRLLSIFGTSDVAKTLCAPDGVQAITVDIQAGGFLTVDCRYIPLKAATDELVATLNATDKFIPFQESKPEWEVL